MIPILKEGIPWVVIGVFAALPIFGLISGPAYASMIFGLAAIRLLNTILTKREWPSIDHKLLCLAIVFAASCWASTLWSVNPTQTLRGSLQVTLIFIAALAFMAHEDWPPHFVRKIVTVLAGAMIVGAAITTVDILSGYKLTFLHAGWYLPLQGHKYNRGINYLVFLAWPVLAHLFWLGRPRLAVTVAVFVALPVIFGLSGSARAAAAAGLVALALTSLSPRRGVAALKAVALLLPVSLPALLWAFSGYRAALAPHLPTSGTHRLEIWDYMAARILERPILGWGFSTAKSLPVTAEEIQHYLFADGTGIHPHNQWIELWVALGGWGMMLGGTFLLLVLRRIADLPGPARPFAYALFAAAMACSFVNYELSTDSWWAALAASAFLFTTLSGKTVSVHGSR